MDDPVPHAPGGMFGVAGIPRGLSLTVNGQARTVPAGTTVRALLGDLGIHGLAAVECNREIVPRASQAGHLLADGDTLEIVHFVGGG